MTDVSDISFAAEMAQIAADMLDEDGMPMVLRVAAPPDYDPETGTVADAYQDLPVRGVILTNADRRVSGALVRAEQKVVLIAAQGLAVVPDPTKDQLIIAGIAYSIDDISPTAPNGIPIIYELTLATDSATPQPWPLPGA